jgi:hypothetical protein
VAGSSAKTQKRGVGESPLALARVFALLRDNFLYLYQYQKDAKAAQVIFLEGEMRRQL